MDSIVVNRVYQNTNIIHRYRHTQTYYLVLFLMLFAVFEYYYGKFIELNDHINFNVSMVIYVLICGFLFLDLLSSSTKKITPQTGLVVLLVFFMALSILSHLSALGLTLYSLTSLLCLYKISTCPLTKKEATRLFWIFVGMALIILLNTSKKYAGNEEEMKKLFNPNSGGFLLTLLFCMSLCRLERARGIKKIPFLILSSVSVVGQQIYGSRTALLGLLVFLVLFLFLRPYKRIGKNRMAFHIIMAALVAGICFAYIYSEILYKALGKGFVIFGKDLFTGRQNIWHDAFQSIYKNLLFGVGSHFHEEYATISPLSLSVHNQPLGIIVHFGIIVAILYFIGYAYFVSLIYTKNRKITLTPLCFWIVITGMSYFDTYFFAGYNLLPILSAFAVIIGFSHNTAKKRRKEHS